MADPRNGFGLHPGTLVFAISLFGFVLAAISMGVASSMREHRSDLVAWSKAMGSAGGGFLLYFLRGHGPWFLTFVLANVLVVAGSAHSQFAFARLLGRPSNKGPVAAVAAFALSGVLASYAFGVPIGFAVFTVSAGIAVILGTTAVLLVRQAWRRRTTPSTVAALVTAAMAAGFMVRALVAAFGDAATVAPSADSPTQVGALLVGTVFVVASSVSFFALVHERQRLALVESASRDSLTGVRTRAAFFEQVAELQRRPVRPPYAVVMVDIDHFKSVNDTHGHAAGDVTLAHAGRLLANLVRIGDVVGRYGGEEFSLLLHECDEAQAGALAERIVAEAARQSVRLADGRSLGFTVSAGYAVARQEGREPFDEVIERADQALLRAKREGRNRALSAEGPAGPAQMTLSARSATMSSRL